MGRGIRKCNSGNLLLSNSLFPELEPRIYKDGPAYEVVSVLLFPKLFFLILPRRR